jgi:hypothetical protein
MNLGDHPLLTMMKSLLLKKVEKLKLLILFQKKLQRLNIILIFLEVGQGGLLDIIHQDNTLWISYSEDRGNLKTSTSLQKHN